MARIVSSALIFGLVAFTLGLPGVADDRHDHWHQWRGPDANGFAARGNPPVEWSEEKNVRWKVAIPGRGSATPILWGDRLFVLTAIKTDREAPAAEPAARHTSSDSRFRMVADEQPATPAGGVNTPPADAVPPAAGQRREGGRRGGGRGRDAPNTGHRRVQRHAGRDCLWRLLHACVLLGRAPLHGAEADGCWRCITGGQGSAGDPGRRQGDRIRRTRSAGRRIAAAGPLTRNFSRQGT